jgi:hypothetical protein
VLEKHLARPAMLDGDLREQQTPAAALLHHESVAPHVDLCDLLDFAR